jgi:hypothetical protein
VPAACANRHVLPAHAVVLVSERAATKADAEHASAEHPTWRRARPLGSKCVHEAEASSQLGTLTKARALVDQVISRMPSAKSAGRAADSKGGVVVHHEASGHLSMSLRCHRDAAAELRFDVHMVDMWHADVVLRVAGLGTGLLPLLSLIHESDLLAEYLPRQAGLPYIEALDIEKRFASNEWVYHCFVSPVCAPMLMTLPCAQARWFLAPRMPPAYALAPTPLPAAGPRPGHCSSDAQKN